MNGEKCSCMECERCTTVKDCHDVSESTETAGYMFEVGKKYRTSDGFVVEFVRHKKYDGMYHVFRHGKDLGYKPYYTDEYGFTKDGMRVYYENKG